MSGFDWCSDSDIVLRAYGSIAVHENPNGDVVVRQERGQLEDEDQTVCIPIQDAEYFANAMSIRRRKLEPCRQPSDRPSMTARSASPALRFQLRTAGRRLSHKTEMVGQGQ